MFTTPVNNIQLIVTSWFIEGKMQYIYNKLTGENSALKICLKTLTLEVACIEVLGLWSEVNDLVHPDSVGSSVKHS